MATGRARSAALAALALFGAAALALGTAWWQRRALAEWLALRELRARGVPAELRVARLELRGAELSGLKLGTADAPDLTLAHARLAWSWQGLRAGRLDAVTLRGLRVRARLDERGVQLGALDALINADTGASAAPPVLPFLEARLEDAEARIESPHGALRVQAAGSARPEGAVVRAELTLHGESAQGEIDFGGGATVGLDSQEIAATGALGGVTPWGRASGMVRLGGSLAALRGEFSGSVEPDARALAIRAGAPIEVEGEGSRDAAGAVEARGTFRARELDSAELGSVAKLEGEVTLRSAAGGLAANATFAAAGAHVAGVARAAHVEGAAELRGERLEANAELRQIELEDSTRAEGASVRGSYDLATGALTARVEVPQALAPALARADGLTASLALTGGALSGDVRIARLVEQSQPALIAPLRVDAKLSGSPERIAIAGTALTPGAGLAFDLRGAFQPAAGELELRVVLPETDVTPEARQPARVFPWLADLLRAVRGKIGGEALAIRASDGLSASGVVALNGVDLTTEWGTVRGLMGVVTATAIDPLETPPGQTLWMQSVDAGLPLGAGTLKFQLLPGDVLHVESAEWGLAEGKLRFSGPLSLSAEERSLTLRVEDLSLEALLKALDFEGLSATGLLSGDVPVMQRGAQIFVRNAGLRATRSGVIRFQPGAGGPALARKQPALATVLGALENLEYDEASLIVNGDATDRVDVKLHVRGRNPNYQKGRPVVLNVNVDLPLGSLLRAAAAASGVPDEIEEQVQRAMGKEKP